MAVITTESERAAMVPPASQPPSGAPEAPPAESAALEERRVYAYVLEVGLVQALLLLPITFIVYMAGGRAPHVPLHKLSEWWTLSAKDFAAKAGISRGWGWVDKLSAGDYLNLIGIIFLASITMVAYLRVLPVFVRRKDFIFAGIVVAELIVMALAASGLCSVGH